MKELWAAQVIQRTIRGYLGRTKFKKRRIFIASQVEIARIWRGALARIKVGVLIAQRNKAATMMQGLWRKRKARKGSERKKGKKMQQLFLILDRLCTFEETKT